MERQPMDASMDPDSAPGRDAAADMEHEAEGAAASPSGPAPPIGMSACASASGGS